MIKISVSQLERSPVILRGEEPPEFLDLPENGQYTISSPMRYDLAVSPVSGGALLQGECRVEITGSCGRCLEVSRQEISTGKLCLLFELADVTEELDVSEDIRSEMLLALPMNFLCSDDCAGLCPVCGANRNKEKCRCHEKSSGSPAWAALDDLKL